MISSEDFKKNWGISNLDRWTDFNYDQLKKSPLSTETKELLKSGFPEDAAPFLSFGWSSYQGQFYNIYDYYRKMTLIKKPWIFGYWFRWWRQSYLF